MGICYMSQETQTGNLHHLEGWDGAVGREVQEGEDVCVPLADSCWGSTENRKFCKAIIFQWKIN